MLENDHSGNIVDRNDDRDRHRREDRSFFPVDILGERQGVNEGVPAVDGLNDDAGLLPVFDEAGNDHEKQADGNDHNSAAVQNEGEPELHVRIDAVQIPERDHRVERTKDDFIQLTQERVVRNAGAAHDKAVEHIDKERDDGVEGYEKAVHAFFPPMKLYSFFRQRSNRSSES